MRCRILLMFLVVALLVTSGCASTPKKDLPAPSTGAATTVRSDAQLFQEGYALLGTSYSKARDTFDQLIRLYPKSKWRPYAETYMKLLDDVKAASNRVIGARQEERKAKQEAEELRVALDHAKKANRLPSEKLQSEIAKLQQENEQLKNDLQRLKNLEVQLQRRERSIR
ncbi:MAG: hypothetical protein CSYNP_00219 [Syntrophus sp. SKADARSKE-3]|nr:hypothetical protein [Syntrophus sp. SKADARSKE-3]